MHDQPLEVWGAGAPYERYVGRWSRTIAREFLDWLAISAGAAWADVGCGTGALVEGILSQCAPASVVGIDRSEGFIQAAARQLIDPRVRFQVGDATSLPLDTDSYDVAVSGLVLNFVSDPAAMVREMIRVTRPGGAVAAYVWDYAGGMAMMRHFWDAAIAVSPEAAARDQAERFPLCQPQPLDALWEDLGLSAVSVRAIDIPTVFRDFEDYWTPFLGKQGAAPTYLASVDEETQERIRSLLESRLQPGPDGTIALTARAWAVQGHV
ncbi:MAG: class I SAM-dependent methyltransferase [Chloroflexi bacterium]|nr:class I SAM-dependent methyltransferase [Chloroflexota bacterium]